MNYKYKMNLGIMNILAIILFIPLFFIIKYLDLFCYIDFDFIIYYFLWMFLHELLHGIGFYLFGGRDIYFGICLEKGIMYCLCKEKVSKNCIMTSLIFPFVFIGVFTFFVGLFFNNSLLMLLSLFNMIGCIGDLVMFFYFLRLPLFSYIDTGECDSFTLISSSDLSRYKSVCFKLVDSNFLLKSSMDKRIKISKFSIVVLIVLFITYLLV